MWRTAAGVGGERLLIFGRPPGTPDERPQDGRPDWMQVRPAEIRRALERAQRLPSGNWYVLDASRRIGERPAFFWVAGRELVAWRSRRALHVAPNSCPHLAAPLSEGSVQEGHLVCPWHGLRLGDAGQGSWAPLPTYEDGVLAWVRLDGDEAASDRPVLPRRPRRFIEATVRIMARCQPDDVVANRLDPWHGTYFHPHTFARLRVIGLRDDVITLRVAFRVMGPACVEVDCTFHCPDPRTIVMTIIDGEGAGSVVETHATPVAAGHTAIIETTLATSERLGFVLARATAPLVRPLIERAALRLWREDAAYAERTAYLRSGARPEPWIAERGALIAPGARGSG